ncbi:MAG: SEL1-like repeat protein [Rhodospirillales bacterium]|nr:SEL1-like repeat protein [Rhodospirillales bacterium]
MWRFERLRRVALRAPLVLTVGLLAVGLSACAQQAKTGATATAAAQEAAQGKDLPTDADALYAQAMVLVQSDPAQAGLMLEGAALQGHGDAAYQLGLMQTDANRRIEWHSMAASLGQVDAEYALGEAYLNGIGTAKEPAWGLSWFERAARAGHAPAQYALGMALSTGLTGPAMYEEALVWLLIAKKNGFADADLLIGFLEARLSSSVLASVQERADAWTNEPVGDAEGRATTRFAQHALGRLGFDAGLADGIQGGRTDMAVSAFRQSQGLEPGGLDGRTLDALRERLAVLNR